MTVENFWKNRIREGSVLSPADRISEVLFGLIMVLTFTGAISAATDGRQEIRELLWAALGCNVAWGIVDALMYLMNLLVERGHNVLVLKKIQATTTSDAARSVLREEIQPVVAALLTDNELDNLGERIRKLPEPSKTTLLTGKDMLAGLEIFLLVFLCTFPVAIPFAILDEVPIAMRASNGIALVMLFIGGFLLARYAGFRRITTAVIYTFIGVLMVAITMALGG